MLAASFRKWPDPLLDFGLEVEAARQIALGKVFSRDVALLHGPLTFETQAMLFRVFGPSLAVAFAANLLVLAGAAAVAYRLLARAAGRFAATAAGLVFLLVLALGQYTPGGNYNWASPYTAGSTWGLFLGLLMVEMLAQYAEGDDLRNLVVGGLSLGLCFLTKSEPFLAALLAAVAGMALLFLRWEEGTGDPRESELPAPGGGPKPPFLRMKEGHRASPTKVATAFITAALVPPFLFFLFYATPRGSPRSLAPSEALRAVLGPWPILFGSAASRMPLYREVMGTSDPGANLAALVKWTFVDLCVFLPAMWAAMKFQRAKRPGRLILILALSVVVLFLSSTFRSNGWFDVARPLPLFLVAVLLVLLLSKKGSPVPFFPAFALSVLALALLSKTALATRLSYFGFTLAMPAALLAVAALTGWIPEWLTARGGDGRVFRLYACGVLAVLAAVYVSNTAYRLSRRTCAVVDGADLFFANERGCFVQKALDEIARSARPGDTLAVLPEGAMVNFLARRSNPTPYLNFMPLEIAVFGEERMLTAYRAHPPDWILLAHRDSSEFGPRFFGVDFARETAVWIVDSYTEVLLLGDPPFEGPDFGMRLLKRRVAR